MSTRNTIAVVLTLVSVVVLYFGLTLPLITISASMWGNEIFTETRSIVSTIRSLHDSGNDVVAGLILLFGIIVPLVKVALMAASMLLKTGKLRLRIFRFVSAISKWAMADVFIVGVYVAHLAAKANDNLDAVVEKGFYFFATYCVVSMLALQFMKLEASPDEFA